MQTHIAVLDADEAVTMFEQAQAGEEATFPEAVEALVPGLDACQVVPVPATERLEYVATGTRALMLLGAARQVAGSLLVPGDLLVLVAGERAEVAASDDDQDYSLLLVWS